MLLTRECDYAIRILRILSSGELSNVAQIAEAEEVTVRMIYKLAGKLEKAGLIGSQRGVAGGYYLAAPLSQVTLYDVCMAVEQDLLVTECMKNGYRCSRDSEEHRCKVHVEFCRIQTLLLNELKSRTLAEIMEIDG